MAERKFFSGLTPRMVEHRAGGRPDRMKTQFFWPEDETCIHMPVQHTKRVSRSNSRDSPPWEQTSQYGGENATVIRERKNQQLQSRIEFYDFLHNQKEPVANSKSKNVSGDVQKDVNAMHAMQEKLSEVRLEQAVETKLPPASIQCDQTFEIDSEDEYYEKKRCQQRIRPFVDYGRPSLPRTIVSRPRIFYTDYEDEFMYPVRTSSREHFDLLPRPNRTQHYRERPLPRRMTYDDYDERYSEATAPSTMNKREEFDEPIDRDFYYEEPAKNIELEPSNKLINAEEKTVKRPLRRTMSICSDAPSEISRAMSRRHLKSNIFFNDKELLENQPRPRTIREAAAMSKVCVGLPDIQ